MKLHYKIAIGVTIIQSGFLIFSTGFNAERFKTSIREEFASKTDSKTQFLALKISRFIESGNLALAEKEIKKHQTEDPIIYAKVIKNKETVLNIKQTDQFESSSLDGNRNFAEYIKKTQNENRILDAFAPIIDLSNKVVGELQLGMSFYELDETISKYYRNQFVMLFIQIIILNSFVWVLSYLITRRLSKLEEICETVDIGNLNFDITHDETHDEIGSLSRSFVKMTRELNKAVRERDEQKEKTIAASKMSALGEMAGGVAHEINNPLAIIVGKIDLIRTKLISKKISEEELLNEIQKIDHTSQRIVRIIRGLRNFSRDGDNDPFVKTPIKQIVDDTLELCRARFTNKGIEFRVKVEDTLKVECRSVQISQILLNLLNNSLHAIESRSEKWISIDARSESDLVVISITDSGTGIPDELKTKLLQPTFTTKDIGLGAGLGLSISLGIAQQHHGTIKLNTQSPNTCFEVYLPVVQRERDAA